MVRGIYDGYPYNLTLPFQHFRKLKTLKWSKMQNLLIEKLFCVSFNTASNQSERVSRVVGLLDYFKSTTALNHKLELLHARFGE